MVFLEPFDKDDLETSLRIRQYTAVPKELKNADIIIFHCPFDLIFLDKLRKPSVFYNHRSGRPYTFMLKEIIKHRDPYRRKIVLKDLNWVTEKHKELYEKADVIISNSNFTQKIMREVFNLDSFMVYPPVDLDKFHPVKNPTRNFFFSAQRVHWQKRIDIQIEAFAGLNERLIIVGSQPDGSKSRELERLAEDYDNITVLGRVSNEELLSFYQNAKATIQTGLYEDFGLIPIESFACGTPAIVVDEAGFKETVHSPELGVRIKPPYAENLRKAIQNFDVSMYDPEVLRKEAEKYGLEPFKREMEKYIKLAVERHGNRL